MNPTPRPTPTSDPGDAEALLDLLRGEIDPRDGQALEARLRADPALARERDALARFLRAARASHDPAPDAVATARVADRVRLQVAAEEAQVRREHVRRGSNRQRVWTRVLLASLGVHVLVLGLLAWRDHDPSAPDERRRSFDLTVGEPRESIAREETSPWPVLPPPVMPSIRAEAVTDEQLLAEADAANREPGLPPLAESPLRIADHPPGVDLVMQLRLRPNAKVKRLELLSSDAKGTLEAVRRGLGGLRSAQQDDGSWAGGDARTAVGETALALLPFLAEGNGSLVSTSDLDGGVARTGLQWLRLRVFGDGTAATEIPAKDLGLALMALSEDYMLSYGRFAPSEADRRGQELRALVKRVEAAQRPDGSFPGAAGDPSVALWPMWALDSAARTGAAAPSPSVATAFRRWFAAQPLSAQGLPARADGASEPLLAAGGMLLARDLGPEFQGFARSGEAFVVAAGVNASADPLYALVAASGLYLRDPAGYRTFSRGAGEELARRLGPNGRVREGDPVGDTALVLLALQSAYRTY
jgi:hypothetical protein